MQTNVLTTNQACIIIFSFLAVAKVSSLNHSHMTYHHFAFLPRPANDHTFANALVSLIFCWLPVWTCTSLENTLTQTILHQRPPWHRLPPPPPIRDHLNTDHPLKGSLWQRPPLISDHPDKDHFSYETILKKTTTHKRPLKTNSYRIILTKAIPYKRPPHQILPH